jgi:hypothetical protein
MHSAVAGVREGFMKKTIPILVLLLSLFFGGVGIFYFGTSRVNRYQDFTSQVEAERVLRSDAPDSFRTKAMGRLLHLAKDPDVPLIRQIAQQVENGKIKGEALMFLGKTGDWESMEMFFENMQHSDQKVRSGAYFAATRMLGRDYPDFHNGDDSVRNMIIRDMRAFHATYPAPPPGCWNERMANAQNK